MCGRTHFFQQFRIQTILCHHVPESVHITGNQRVQFSFISGAERGRSQMPLHFLVHLFGSVQVFFVSPEHIVLLMTAKQEIIYH